MCTRIRRGEWEDPTSWLPNSYPKRLNRIEHGDHLAAHIKHRAKSRFPKLLKALEPQIVDGASREDSGSLQARVTGSIPVTSTKFFADWQCFPGFVRRLDFVNISIEANHLDWEVGVMRTVGLFEAKQKLSELVERAREGEKIGITRRGELTAVLIPAARETSLRDVFQDIETIRKRAKLSRSAEVKELIEEGRT